MKLNKFWNFINNEDDTAELLIYGDIVSEKSWWSDDNEVTPNDFSKELNELGDKNNIIVRINSGGGDVFSAFAIYTMLKDNKAKITIKIDGIAASAATIIAMAGDIIEIPNYAIFMIHDPMSVLWGYYNTTELNKISKRLDVIKNGIINAYVNKTGKDKDEIWNLMQEETWLTGEDAVNNGFCDKLLLEDENNEDEFFLDNNHLIVNSLDIDLTKFKNANKIKNKLKKNGLTFKNNADHSFFNDKTKKITENKEEIMNKEELKQKYPDIFNEVLQDGVKQERERIKNIEEMEVPGFEDIVNKAKFETGDSAEKVAMNIIKAQKNAGEDYLNNRNEDVKNSGALGVEGNSDDFIKDEKDEKVAINSLVNFMNGGI